MDNGYILPTQYSELDWIFKPTLAEAKIDKTHLDPAFYTASLLSEYYA